MARIPYITPVDAPPAVAETLSNVPPLHVFQLVARAESAFRPWLRLGGTLLHELELDPALRELAILQVGRLAARYEWDQHVPIALAVGVSQDDIDALEAGRLETLVPQHRAVLGYVEAFVAGVVDDALHAALAEHLSDREIVELCLVAGHYLGLARTMSALRIDLEPAAGPEALRISP